MFEGIKPIVCMCCRLAMQMLPPLSGNIVISLRGRCLTFGKLTDKMAGISSIDLSLLMANTSFTLS